MRFFIGDKEKQLVKRLHSGEKTAMKDFYALYADYLTGVCARYIDNDDDLKDVLQDSFIKVLHISESFIIEGPVRFRLGQQELLLTGRSPF